MGPLQPHGRVGPSIYELLGDTNIPSIPAGVEGPLRLDSMGLHLPKLVWLLPLVRARSVRNTGQCCPVWTPLPRNHDDGKLITLGVVHYEERHQLILLESGYRSAFSAGCFRQDHHLWPCRILSPSPGMPRCIASNPGMQLTGREVWSWART